MRVTALLIVLALLTGSGASLIARERQQVTNVGATCPMTSHHEGPGPGVGAPCTCNHEGDPTFAGASMVFALETAFRIDSLLVSTPLATPPEETVAHGFPFLIAHPPNA